MTSMRVRPARLSTLAQRMDLQGFSKDTLPPEKCIGSLEKQTLLDLAKLGYQEILEEGVGVVPTLRVISTINKQGTAVLTEG